MPINIIINETEKNKTYLRESRNKPSKILEVPKNKLKKYKNPNSFLNQQILHDNNKIIYYHTLSEYQEEYFW